MTLAVTPGARAGDSPINLALVARPTTSYVSGHETLDAINDGFEPRWINDHRHGCYGNWPRTGTQWVQYDWSQAITTDKIDVYWWDDSRGVRLPKACRLLYWDGQAFVPVEGPSGLGVEGGHYNTTTFSEVTTRKLRLEFDGKGDFSTGIIEWKVYDSGKSPRFAPRVSAGVDRIVVLPAKTYLHASVRGASDSTTWSKAEGPGAVEFANPGALETTASFSIPGEYALKLTAANGGQSASDTLHVSVKGRLMETPLEPVAMRRWDVNSPLWSARLKELIVNWIPHCVAELSKPDLKEGGFENFIQAANKNAGRPHGPHVGPPWADAYTLNTVESICLALMLDPRGDSQLAAAQGRLRRTLDDWIPVILAAQEPDGYFQTRFTLGYATEHDNPPPHWTRVGDHEGYVGGYFIEAAIADYRLTSGHDRRLYNAAKKLADCWYAHIGPSPKKKWYCGHEEIEQALVRLARLVDQVEGPRQGDKYVRLSKFLLDCRRNGSSYDQTQAPVIQQYEAVGHAVRAGYLYSAMADIAMETGDPQYQSAVESLWNSVVNAKYYITGGVGSGETSEGFGKNYSLPNHSYCESCADCAEVLFQHNMNLAFRQASYADLFEDSLYNAVLGSVDLPAKNFTYTNPLDSRGARYPWHTCPCCVGNIPRTLLELPRWMYARNANGLFINLYAGSTVDVGPVAGTDVKVVQSTAYPWDGHVEILLNPSLPSTFTLHLRAPYRNVSALYHGTPEADGITSLALNGEPITPEIKDGYAHITRTWKPGDAVVLELPMRVQRVTADPRIAADRGRVALRYGPLIYNIESVDQNISSVLDTKAPLTTQWEPHLLDGVVVIHGRFTDGSPLLAIPNYARLNRGGRSLVWIRAR